MRTIPFFITLLVFLAGRAFAQTQEKVLIDSLTKQLAITTADTARLSIFQHLIFAYAQTNPRAGFPYRNEVQFLLSRVKDHPGTGKIYEHLGRLYLNTGNYPEALKLYNAAYATHLKKGDRSGQAYMLVQIGQVYVNDGNYAKGREYLQQAVKLSESIKDNISLAAAYDILIYSYTAQGNMVEASRTIYLFIRAAEASGGIRARAHANTLLATNFKAAGNHPEALQYYRQALTLLMQTGDKIGESSIYSYIADEYLAMGRFKDALHYYDTAMHVALLVVDSANLLGDLHKGKGNVFKAMGDHRQALVHFQTAAAHFNALANYQALASLYSEMGTAYTKLGEYQSARQAFDKSIALGKNLESTVSMSDYYSGLQILDSAMGNWKSAYQHYKQYITLRDSIFNSETLRKLVAAQLQYENDRKAAELRSEQEKKDLRAREVLRQQRNIRNTAIGALAVVLLFSVVFYRQRNRIAREKKRSDQLVVDKELLVKEIHHRVKNNLEVVSSLLALQAAKVNEPVTRQAMHELQNRIHSIGIVHQKLYQGKDPGLIEMKDYFMNLSESILDSFAASESVHVSLPMEKILLDIDTAVPIGLIVNELLTNTLKYAFPDNRKGEIQIKLSRSEEILILEVADNGIGKSGKKAGTGFGSALIGLLIRQLNGHMREEQNQGTAVFIEFRHQAEAGRTNTNLPVNK